MAGSNYAWRSVHNHMLMRRSVVLDNLAKIIPPIDPDQRVALLHTPFRGTTLFRGELAKVYRANKEHASSNCFTQQLPFSLTPLNLIQAEVDPSGRVAPPTGAVAGTGIIEDPPLCQQLLDHPSLETVRPP